MYLYCGKRQLYPIFRTKKAQPAKHDAIAGWVGQYFGEQIILHKRAVSLLKDKSARKLNIDLICDALDFLATDYWAQRYAQLPKEEMLNRCLKKYNRQLEITRNAKGVIGQTPQKYKIKYFPEKQGELAESVLDYHLKVGNKADILLRIYFLHDDEKNCD